MEKRKIGIGYENYKEFVDQDMYYIDKTLLIRDILAQGGKVTLFTRPRRFGKTLALSMLRTFFEAEIDLDGKPVNNSRYFEGKKIMDCGGEVLSRMGKYPVIKLSLKSAKQPDFSTAFSKLREDIIFEFMRHAYLLDSEKLDPTEKERMRDILSGDLTWEKLQNSLKNKREREGAFVKEVGRYATALKTLSIFLKKHHGQNVIVLLDEYDVPLEMPGSPAFTSRWLPSSARFSSLSLRPMTRWSLRW